MKRIQSILKEINQNLNLSLEETFLRKVYFEAKYNNRYKDVLVNVFINDEGDEESPYSIQIFISDGNYKVRSITKMNSKMEVIEKEIIYRNNKNGMIRVEKKTKIELPTFNGIIDEELLNRAKSLFLIDFLKDRTNLVKHVQKYPEQNRSEVEMSVDVVILTPEEFSDLRRGIKTFEGSYE